MTKDEVIEYFKEKGLIRGKGDVYSLITDKKLIVRCVNLPKKYIGTSSTQAMQLFFDDIGVSFTTGSLQYNLRTHTRESLKIFMNILKDDSIDFSILVAKTKSYYSSDKTVKPSISKYFMEGTWKTVYDSYETNKSELGNTRML